MKLAVTLLLLVGVAMAADRVKTFYKTARVSESVIGISCPGNGGDPTVIGNYDGTLLVSCGTK